MRLAGMIAVVLGLSATVAAASVLAPQSVRAPKGSGANGASLLVEEARGTVRVEAKGVLVGRMDQGSLVIVDLSTTDQWSPRVWGIPRGKVVSLRGKNVSFYVPGGTFRLTAKGSGISISARGSGSVMLDGDPDPVKNAGSYAIGDADPAPLPTTPTTLTFGPQPSRTSS